MRFLWHKGSLHLEVTIHIYVFSDLLFLFTSNIDEVDSNKLQIPSTISIFLEANK